jgi:delta 1-pyrroline-5-carboxylate dehydrogenase
LWSPTPKGIAHDHVSSDGNVGDRYRQKVAEQVDEAPAQGARILAGGRRPPQFEHGFFYEPTVLTNVDHSFRIMREETFGPTTPIMAYRTFDEAIALANDSDYGLGANLYSNDPRKIKQYYEEVKAGACWVNDPLTGNDAGPFGDMKVSGGARAGRGGAGRVPGDQARPLGFQPGAEKLVVSLRRVVLYAVAEWQRVRSAAGRFPRPASPS